MNEYRPAGAGPTVLFILEKFALPPLATTSGVMGKPVATLFRLDKYALHFRIFLLDPAIDFSDVGLDLLRADVIAKIHADI